MGHVKGFFGGSIVNFRVLKVAEEDGINGHAIAAEKQPGNEISPQYGTDDWNYEEIGWRYAFIDTRNFVCEDVE